MKVKKKINNPENENEKEEKEKGKEKYVLHGAPKKARRSKTYVNVLEVTGVMYARYGSMIRSSETLISPVIIRYTYCIALL